MQLTETILQVGAQGFVIGFSGLIAGVNRCEHSNHNEGESKQKNPVAHQASTGSASILATFNRAYGTSMVLRFGRFLFTRLREFAGMSKSKLIILLLE